VSTVKTAVGKAEIDTPRDKNEKTKDNKEDTESLQRLRGQRIALELLSNMYRMESHFKAYRKDPSCSRKVVRRL